MSRQKAKIVVQEFTQIQGVDFKNMYADTVRLESFQLLLVIVASERLEL